MGNLHCLQFRQQLLPQPRGDKGIFESMMRLVKIKVVHLCQSLQADVFHLLGQAFLPRAVL